MSPLATNYDFSDPILAAVGIAGLEIFEHLFDGLYITDLERKIIFWNQAAQHITGFSAKDMLGRKCMFSCLQHIAPVGSSLCSTHCPLTSALRSRQEHQSELFLLHKDGHRLPTHVKTLPIWGPDKDMLGLVEIFNDSSAHIDLHQQIARLREQAYLDQLTDLPNRRFLDHQLERLLLHYQHNAHSFAIIFADIDNFKAINDTHGHDVGDRVLVMVAKSMQVGLRLFDVVGRWGGEEFLCILPQVNNMKLLSQIADRLRMLVQNSRLSSPDLSVTISLGLTLVQEDDNSESLLKRADQRLYQAKQQGRNRICC